MFCFDAFGCFVEIVFIELESDEVAFLFDASHGGSAGAHAVVKYGVALVGVGADEVADEADGLLGGVPTIFIVLELDDVARIICVFLHECFASSAKVPFAF